MNYFDKWNKLKKRIDISNKNKKYHAGDIWWCNLGKNIGFEQNGMGCNFERPILILKGFNKKVCLIVPLTTKGKENKFYFKLGIINKKDNFAVLSQIRLIDTKRLINKICFLQYRNLKSIKKAIWELIR